MALAALVGVGLLLAGSALATGVQKKQFSAAISATPGAPEDDSPADAAAEAYAGTTPTVAITLTNLASSQYLGSANIVVPAGITFAPASLTLTSTQWKFDGTVSSAGTVIKLRNLYLSPGKSVTVRLGAQTTCAPSAPSYGFATSVKQSNDFNGTGNDFTITGPQPALDLVGACSLAFRAQPAAAQRATDITSETYLPTGAPITVAVRDGSGAADVPWWTSPIAISLASNPGAGTLSGTTSATPSSGVASFLPRIDKSASGYTLTASSSGIVATAPVSSPFTIVDSGQRCTGGTCAGTAAAAKTTATVSGTASAGDILSISLGAPTIPAYQCAGYTTTAETLEFDLTTLSGAPSGGLKTATFTLLKQYVTKPADKYQACFASPQPFTTKSGAPAAGVDTDGNGIVDTYVGLLPLCSSYKSCYVGPPCITSRVKDRYGNVILTITAPPGDPRVKF